MATPLTADQLLKALRGEGLKVVEWGQWRTNNRNHKGAFGPVHGIMIHHTVTAGDTATQTKGSVELCYNGHADLPGPLCHGVIAKDGTVYLVGNGRANHAGSGDDDVLTAVINETAPLPPDNETNTDGNRSFYGFEAINRGDGKDPWPAAQLLAIERVSAAIARAHGWTERSVIGHLEWQPGKIDPRGFGMDWLRGQIRTRLAGPAQTPAPPKETAPMALTQAEIQAIAAETAKLLLRTDGQYLAPKDASDWSPDVNDSAHWWSGTTVFDVLTTEARRMRRNLKRLMDAQGVAWED